MFELHDVISEAEAKLKLKLKVIFYIRTTKRNVKEISIKEY